MESSSRFQRLFDVLENGTSPATRYAAAQQIAEIYLQMSESQRADFLNVLFQKVGFSLNTTRSLSEAFGRVI